MYGANIFLQLQVASLTVIFYSPGKTGKININCLGILKILTPQFNWIKFNLLRKQYGRY